MREYTVYWRFWDDDPLLTRTASVYARDSLNAEECFIDFMKLSPYRYDVESVVMVKKYRYVYPKTRTFSQKFLDRIKAILA